MKLSNMLTQKSTCESNFTGEQKIFMSPKRINVCESNTTLKIAKAKRQKISERVRFKIFRRDGFTCQYCGRVATEMELSIDHIIPVSKNGTNNFDNLITACMICNRGKSDENVVIEETKTHTEELVYINNPLPEYDIIGYKGLMDFLDIKGNIVHRVLMRYKPGEPAIPREKILPPKKRYASVKLHGEQFKSNVVKTKPDSPFYEIEQQLEQAIPTLIRCREESNAIVNEINEWKRTAKEKDKQRNKEAKLMYG